MIPKATEFYQADASEVYSANFDFTIIEPNSIPKETKNRLLQAIKLSLASAVIATATGIFTVPVGVTSSFEIANITEEAPRPPTMVKMTAAIQERAAMTDILFRQVPHPDDDDVEPDYGF